METRALATERGGARFRSYLPPIPMAGLREAVDGGIGLLRDAAARRRERRGWRGHARRVLAIGLVGMLVFSAYGTLLPSQLRCDLPAGIGCPGGVMGPQRAAAGPTNEQWFNITMYDYGFWIVNTVDGTNETSAWTVYEGWTVHVNTTSLPADPSVGGTAYHGIGVELNATGTQLLSLVARVGQWASGSFVAPSQRYSDQHIWCTVGCGPGHGGMQLYNLFIVPATIVPTASASANRTSGVAPLAISLTGAIHGGTAPYSVSWDFGDGSPTVLTQNTTHTYTIAGNYSALFTVSDAHAYKATSSVAIQVIAYTKLSVGLSGLPPAGVAPLLVGLHAGVSGGFPPYAIAWTLGDGATATGPTVGHLYSAVGVFGVSVAVTDSAHSVVRAQASVTITRPTGHFGLSVSATPNSGYAPLSVSFTATPTAGAAPFLETWFFGDGSVGTGPSIAHTYNLTGAYEATVFATDSAGRVGANRTAVAVSGPPGTPLQSLITETPSSGPPPLDVNASVSIFGGSSIYNTIHWNFGDGTTSTGPTASHRYATLGTYNLSATASDSFGATTVAWAIVTLAGVTLSVGLNRTSGDAPFSVGAVASVQGGSGSYAPVQWNWGDGTTSSGTPANHSYAATVVGNVVIRATVADSGGNQTNSSATLAIFLAPTATLTQVVPASVDFPKTVTFTLTMAGGSGNYSTTPLWTFGDGHTTRGASPQSHTYSRPGHYRVSVASNDSLGTVAVAAVWTNLTLGGVGGVPGSSQQWVFNGVGDPDQAALALIGIIAASGLVILYRGGARKRAPAVAPPAPPRPSGTVRRSSGEEEEATPP